MVLAAALLALQLAAVGWFLHGDRAEYRSFKRLTATADRQHRYRRWSIRLWLAFALPAFATLIVLGRPEAMRALPPEFAMLRAQLPPIGGRTFLIGLLGGSVGGLLANGLLLRRRVRPLGDIEPMLPRNRAEAACTTWLSVSAGITEELAFRLTLPLLLILLGAPPLAAFGAATLLFGALHLYQGWVGVAATTLLGAVLAAAYLATGSLALAMLVHVVIDLNGLVLRPWLTGVWSLRPSAASPSGRSR